MKIIPTLNSVIKLIDGFSGTANKIIRKIDEMSIKLWVGRNATNNLNNSLKNVGSGAGTANDGISKLIDKVASLETVQKTLNLSDELSRTAAKLELIKDGKQSVEDLKDMIMATANRSRSSFLDTANILANLRTSDVFDSNKEALVFSEIMNKMFVMAGASQQEIITAGSQLTQALRSGSLNGEDLNAIFKTAPNMIQTIADYMNAPVSKIQELAAEGQVTADVVKNALFSASSEVNDRFGDVPMTFSQSWTLIQNSLLETFQPLLGQIADGAKWIADNWSTIEPIFYGVAAAVGAYAVGTILADIANKGLAATLQANPLMLIAATIGLLVASIYQWAQSVGGFKIAWMIVVDKVLYGWDMVKYGLLVGGYFMMDLFNKLQISLMIMVTNMKKGLGNLKVDVLNILQDLINGAIGYINSFIEQLNKISGISIDLINSVTFGTEAKLENDVNQKKWDTELNDYIDKKEAEMNQRDQALESMKADAAADAAQRQLEISKEQKEAAERAEKASSTIDPAYTEFSGENPLVVEGTGNNGKVGVDMSDEDIQYLRDIAERDYINKFTTATLAPNVTIKFGNIRETADVDAVRRRIEEIMREEIAVAAEGAY